jgi:GT2 family glycosyltransferase
MSVALPDVTVILLNYNGKVWMHRCLESIRSQTIIDRIELIVADNASTDWSDKLSEQLLTGWQNGSFVQNGANIGFAAGSNRAVGRARGKYLFFLNPDVWLERDCVEQLYRVAEDSGCVAAGPFVLNYDDDTFQSFGGNHFDICGLPVPLNSNSSPDHLFISNGFMFVRRDVFEAVGRYNEQFFLYAEEFDLSWRLWIAGHQIKSARLARIHHRGGASVNPEGGTKIVENRTSDAKRFYANRNSILILLYHAQHILFVLLVPMLALFAIESVIGWCVLRRWSFFRNTFLDALRDCWWQRAAIRRQRALVRRLRRRSDFYMLRFLTWRLAHWEDFRRIVKLGLPVVDARKPATQIHSG